MYTITKHIICELTGYRPGSVEVSTGDRQTRAVACRLMENGTPWVVPENTQVRVAYTLPDGTPGLYDTMPDGTPAGMISGNIVTVLLGDRITAQAGVCGLSIVLLGPGGEQIATWPIHIHVVGPKKMTIPENLPALGAGFEGRLLYGGPGGVLTPLSLGSGVRVERLEDGSLRLVAVGGGGGGIYEETDPTVPAWAKQSSKPSYTAEEVGADAQGAAATAVNQHNTSADSHGDLRLAVQQLQAAVNAFMDVDDATRDSLSEVLALIDANADVIEGITTSKVSVADIVDNLVTNLPNRPLSAAQGVALKALIDGLSTGKLDASRLQEAIDAALAQAKESGEFDGADGITPRVGANGNWFIGTIDTGVSSQGRGIKSIARTSGTGAAGTTDTYTITYTDNTTTTYGVYNGKDGKNGDPGAAATLTISAVESLPYGSAPAVVEAEGSTAQARVYILRIPQAKTPENGVDYNTPNEQEALVNKVLAALPKYAGEVEAV